MSILNKKKSNKTSKKRGFSISEVVEITKVSTRQLRWWDENGLVKPIMSPERKPGQTRRYTLQGIVCILVIKALRERGLSLRKIRESVKRVEEVTGVEEPLAKLRVACLAHAVYFKEKEKYFEPISGQTAIENALEKIRPQLAKRRFVPGKRAVDKTNRHYQEKIMAL